MPYKNQSNKLIMDNYANVHSFLLDVKGIKYIYFDKVLRTNENKLTIEDCTLEFDVTIDKKGNIYLVYQRKDGVIMLCSLKNGVWSEIQIETKYKENVYNLNIVFHNNEIHIFYCIPTSKDSRTYTVYHNIYSNDRNVVSDTFNISKREILNPFQVITLKNRLIFGYYDLVDGYEQVFIKIYDNVGGDCNSHIKITSRDTVKLYLDILMLNEDEIHVSYSEYQLDNLVIRYEKYKLLNNKVVKITEKNISNPANCTHPTIVFFNKKLWIAWLEYDNIMSSFSDDMGLNWSTPYLWNESKSCDFTRYKFYCGKSKLLESYKLNYSFGKLYPDFTFIGFGPLNNAVEVPLKKEREESEIYKNMKEKGNKRAEKYEYIEQNLQRLENRVKGLFERIDKLEENIKLIKNLHKEDEHRSSDDNLKNIEERVKAIEKYLDRRRRGPFIGPR